jgi:hypothetical protein
MPTDSLTTVSEMFKLAYIDYLYPGKTYLMPDSLDGPVGSIVECRSEVYRVDKSILTKDEFYSHPKVKKHMLLKALKNLS